MAQYLDMTDFQWLLPFMRAGFVLVVGFYAANFLAGRGVKFAGNRASPQQLMIIKKSIYFVVLLLFSLATLQQLNFDLSVLLGSAGVATVAIGFAAKTSISNLICGLFLILEKSFEVGDTIRVKGHQGEIVSIDLLSVKIRTSDHTLIRLPNEVMLSADVTNLTHYKQRRLDIVVGISYEADVSKALTVLLSVANENPLNSQKPEAKVILDNLGDSAVNLRLSMWVAKKQYDDAKNTLQQAIKEAFDHHKIEIPYPQMTVRMVESTS